MRTLTPGAARRRETAETVRDRISTLFAVEPLPASAPHLAIGASGSDELPDSWPLGPEPASASASGAGAGWEPGPRPLPKPPPDDPPSESRPSEPSGPPLDEGLLVPERRRRVTGPSHARSWPVRSWWPSLMLDRRAVLGLAVLLLLAVGYAVQHFWLGRPQSVPIPAAVAPAAEVVRGAGTTAPAVPAASAAVVVDIAGKVHAPGLRTLPTGSRVADALRLAGGPLPDADTKGLNLARVLTDGEQILVGEPAPLAAATGVSKTPFSLNHATLEQLDSLPGVGPTLAQRILAYRDAHGPFRSLDQLREVSGIGERTFTELRPLLLL